MYEDEFDDAPPRRMQPATKVALGIIGAGLSGLLIVGVVALACRPSIKETSLAQTRQPVRRLSEPPPVQHQGKPEKQRSTAAARPVPLETTGQPVSTKGGERPSSNIGTRGVKAPRQPLEPKAEPIPSAEPSAADEPVPVPGMLLKEVVTGYETRRFQGFTFLLSTQAIKEAQKENGKPFQALQAEFDGLVRVLPSNALKHLRGILVWIEWDRIDHENPNVLAKYYGGRIWRLDGSAHPLKSNAVEVLSLKRLAAEKEAEREKSRLVLLHELAHAVHHLALGFENADVTFAYNQAMDRRLYDKVKDSFGRDVRAYAATNEAEYFAELTCAYLDRCSYFPFTRADLREHDPTGYRLMQLLWDPVKPPSEQKKRKSAGAPARG